MTNVVLELLQSLNTGAYFELGQFSLSLTDYYTVCSPQAKRDLKTFRVEYTKIKVGTSLLRLFEKVHLT